MVDAGAIDASKVGLPCRSDLGARGRAILSRNRTASRDKGANDLVVEKAFRDSTPRGFAGEMQR